MVLIGLNALAILGTQSRGAFLGFIAVAIFFVLKSQKKAMLIVLMLLFIPAVLTFMPQSWVDRMNTIETASEEDSSFKGRLNSWGMAFNMAQDRVLGGGFEGFSEVAFTLYADNPLDVHDAHSIYFEILGEHGFVGLFLFLGLAFSAWRGASWVRKQTKKDLERKWMFDLASMVQVSLVAYAVSGAALGLAYFDYYYILILCVVIMKGMIIQNTDK